MNVLSLCAGIAGLDLGLRQVRPDAKIICYVEIDPFCQEILLRRQDAGWLDRAPIWPDLATFDGRRWRGLVDCVIGGYPCQPFSVAGKQLGAADPRHLWPSVARILRDVEPRRAFFENVAGHLNVGFQEVAEDLESMGYVVTAGLFTAAEVGAPHRRQRLFILADRQSDGHERGGGTWRGREGSEDDCGALGHADEPGSQGRGESVRECGDELPAWPPGPAERDRWAAVLARWPELAPAVADAKRSDVHQAAAGRADGADGVAAARRGSRDDGDVADPENGSTRHAGRGQGARGAAEGDAPQPVVRRVADGAPSRVDRLRACGNAVVPAVAALAWRTLVNSQEGGESG